MKKILFILLTILLLTGCHAPLKKYSNITVDAGFNTFIQLIAYTKDSKDFETYFNHTTKRFKELNQLFDIYHEYPDMNNLYTINKHAGIQPIKVQQEIIDLLLKARYFSELSNGEFDITMGSVLKIWHTYRENALLLTEENKLDEITLPKIEELQKASLKTGWDFIEIDEEQKTVFIKEKGVSLDVGGIAKGYAAEVVALELEALGLKHASINAGGNIRTINNKPDHHPWSIGITHPRSQQHNASIASIKLSDSRAFVTSGDYQNFFITSDLKRYHHIIDNDTLFPAQHFYSITILGNDSGHADALSTTLFTMDYQQGLAFIETYNQAHPEDAIDVIWILDEKNKIDTQYSTIKDGLQIIWTANLNDKISY